MEDQSPVWQSKEWQAAKERLLKDACQQCGQSNQLALVHLWKPPRYQMLKVKVEREMIEQLISEGSISDFDPSTAGSDQLRQACPECRSVNLRKRKTKKPPYKCGRCSSEFANPEEIMVRDEFLYQKTYRKWTAMHLVGSEVVIDERVRELQKQYDEKYRSGEGTVTFCRKCAFLFTQKGMVLCQTCKKKYHKRRYQQCYDCNTEGDIFCEKCGVTKMEPQPGGINICEGCYEEMWEKMTE